MKLRAVFVTLAALCAALPVRGQQLRVTGVVRDTAGSPVGGVVVTTTNVAPSQVVFTRADGTFALAGDLPDTTILEFVHLGYYAQPVGLWRVPRDPQDSTLALAVVVRPQALDTTPAGTAPPLVIRGTDLRDAELQVITRTAGLRQLRAAPPSKAYREIRVYLHSIDVAVSLRQRGGNVFGQVWLWWLIGPGGGSELDAAGNARINSKPFGCGRVPWRWATVNEPTGSTWRAALVCHPAFWTTPDWRGMWRRLDSLGVWRLTEKAPAGRGWRSGMTTGAVVSMELFDGASYRLIRYGDPDSSTAEARKAVAISNALNEVFAAIRHNPTVLDLRPYAVHIRGTVRDRDGLPVVGALVRASAVPTSSRTGADGRFDLPYSVPWGESRLVVEKAGFQPASYPIESLPGWTWDSSGYKTDIVLQPIVGPRPAAEAALALQLLQGPGAERSRALEAARVLGARNTGPELRAALIALLERNNRIVVEAAKRKQAVAIVESPEFIAQVASVVSQLEDPQAIPALAGALNSGSTLVRDALADFGERAAPAVLAVVTAPESHYNAVDEGLIALRFMVEGADPRPLSAGTLDQIRGAARQRLTGKQYFTTLWRAIDLAVALNDPGLRQVVQTLASDSTEVSARGVTNPDLIARTQQLAAQRLAGGPVPPRHRTLSERNQVFAPRRTGPAWAQATCADSNEFSRGIIDHLVAEATSTDSATAAIGRASGIPAASPVDIQRVNDARVCGLAGVAYAAAERDSVLTGGRVGQAGDSTLGKVVHVFRVGDRYLVVDEHNMAGEWAIVWVFDQTFTTPIRRLGR